MASLPASSPAARASLPRRSASRAASRQTLLRALAWGQLPLTLASLAGFGTSPGVYAASSVIAACLLFEQRLRDAFGREGAGDKRLAPLAPAAQRPVGTARLEAEPIDRLTGVLSRPGLLANAAALRPGPGVLVIVDVAGMRAVNVAHGRAQGDRILAALARRIATNIRPDDVLGRWGGDEFVICLPGLCRIEAGRIIARLRSSLAHEPLTAIDREPVSLRIGMADFDAGGTASVETAIREAEEEIHTDKQRRSLCAA